MQRLPTCLQNVIHQFTQVAQDPRTTFLGNVHVGRDVTVDQLRAHYHAVGPGSDMHAYVLLHPMLPDAPQDSLRSPNRAGVFGSAGTDAASWSSNNPACSSPCTQLWQRWLTDTSNWRTCPTPAGPLCCRLCLPMALRAAGAWTYLARWGQCHTIPSEVPDCDLMVSPRERDDLSLLQDVVLGQKSSLHAASCHAAGFSATWNLAGCLEIQR